MREYFSQPGFLPTYGTIGADLSFIMALIFTILFLVGWQLGRKKMGNQHHTLVLWAMVSMLVYFTFYYLLRGLGSLSNEGKEGFGGPEWIYTFIFSPMLTIHILVVSTGLVLAVYMITLGFRVAVRKAGQRVLQSGMLRMSGSAFRKISLGFLIFFGLLAIIRWGSFGRLVVYISGFLLVMGVLLLEKGIERLIPDGEKRHRVIGRFTMVLFVVALITSTGTYVMLYVLWPPAIEG